MRRRLRSHCGSGAARSGTIDDTKGRARDLARLGVDGERIVERRDIALRAPRKRYVTRARNVAEASAPVEERIDGDFVRGVERDRRRRVGVQGVVREADAWKALAIRRLERKCRELREIEQIGRASCRERV